MFARSAALLSLMLALVQACPFSHMLPSELAGLDLSDHATHCPHTLTKVADTPSVTVEGCTCSGSCGATISVGAYNCEWCYTQDSCGHSSLGGHWDYCAWPSQPSYQDQTWQAKKDFLWKQITKDTTSGPVNSPAGCFTESIQVTMDNNQDWLPPGRVKVIHSEGAVCSFTYKNDNTNTSYTGVFNGDLQHGFIRMGSALKMGTSGPNVVPGFGIKFMRSKVKSANFVALVSLDALKDGSYNFFDKTLSNHIPAADSTAAKLLVKKFDQASRCPTMVGLSDAAKYSIGGKAVDTPVFPFRIDFVPADNISTTSGPTSQSDMNQQLAAFPANTALFYVKAYASPAAFKAGQFERIGTLYVEDGCTLSKYGDESLFFQHQRIEDDWKLMPSWINDLNAETDCSASHIQVDPPETCAQMDN